MTEIQDPKMLWFSFLKAFTRALTQINLYKPDHPQVRQALDEGQALSRKSTPAAARNLKAGLSA